MPADFTISPRALRAWDSPPFAPVAGAPLRRPLRVYALDPARSRHDGAVATVRVPYEPLAPGPAGSICAVQGELRADLDSPAALLECGFPASASDPRFRAQMVYALCCALYGTFARALGRDLTWSFPGRLSIRPHVPDRDDAWYDAQRGEICFGAYRAARSAGVNLPGGITFTCLSHDIVVHECTHALLDGLRSHLLLSTGPDVAAFHEAFAAITAGLQRLQYPEVVYSLVEASAGRLSTPLLTAAAGQFRDTTTRRAVSAVRRRAALLVAAVLEAFVSVYRRKTAALLALAPAPRAAGLLTEAACKLAARFQRMCIAAIDYCPPVDIEFGEYLRALITADYNLVREDRLGFREALIAAFARRHIYPRWVPDLGEDALLWQPPEIEIPPVHELSFSALRFAGDPAHAAGPGELERQARALGRVISDARCAPVFRLARPGGAIEPPRIQSIRTARRIGPTGGLVFDLVAEVTQARRIPGEPSPFYGGATVILGPAGEVRYLVSKSVTNQERLNRELAFRRTE